MVPSHNLQYTHRSKCICGFVVAIKRQGFLIYREISLRRTHHKANTLRKAINDFAQIFSFQVKFYEK